MKKKNLVIHLDKWLLLSWRKVWIIIVGGFVSILLHNLFYAIFGFEEAFFFILVVFVLPIYFLTAVVYTILKKAKNILDGKNK